MQRCSAICLSTGTVKLCSSWVYQHTLNVNMTTLIIPVVFSGFLHDIRFSDDWIGLLEVAERRAGALRQHYTYAHSLSLSIWKAQTHKDAQLIMQDAISRVYWQHVVTPPWPRLPLLGHWGVSLPTQCISSRRHLSDMTPPSRTPLGSTSSSRYEYSSRKSLVVKARLEETHFAAG